MSCSVHPRVPGGALAKKKERAEKRARGLRPRRQRKRCAAREDEFLAAFLSRTVNRPWLPFSRMCYCSNKSIFSSKRAQVEKLVFIIDPKDMFFITNVEAFNEEDKNNMTSRGVLNQPFTRRHLGSSLASRVSGKNSYIVWPTASDTPRAPAASSCGICQKRVTPVGAQRLRFRKWKWARFEGYNCCKRSVKSGCGKTCDAAATRACYFTLLTAGETCELCFYSLGPCSNSTCSTISWCLHV
ncbi:hypothetical protein HPB51_028389 [Rhipicephalus microplus]|uniref:Uncharacterized protein n=1 Tax=Rhipicephalus microplus TaxID=6941 RepID=A0A9J6CXF1_RHIMP|nr:hypothetical protein HPB51_028389 [Rhipicephalus microplus]